LKNKTVILRGAAGSPGYAIGYVHILKRDKQAVQRKAIPPSQVAAELKRFESALSHAREQLRQVRSRISKEQGEEHVYLIEAQLMMLEDKSLTEDTRETIQTDRVNAEWALHRSLERFKAMFDKIDDEYFRDRRSDIEYVEERLLRAMAGEKEQEFLSLQRKTVIVAWDLSPADIVKLDRKNLIGLATDIGGRTSHTAIIARSLGIPIVVGLDELTQCAENGDAVIVDGMEGLVLIQPDGKTIADYERKKDQHLKTRKELLKNRNIKAETKDSFEIGLKANVDFIEEVPYVLSNGAEGIGMLRTEHLFLGGNIPASEEEQFEKYKKIVEKMGDAGVVIRMLDLAGDELFLPPTTSHSVLNSALGLRGMRLLLAEPEILKTQLRAILRASAFGRVSILYPMISTIDEVRLTNGFLKDVKEELSAAHINFDQDIETGVLIEVPSAALQAHLISQEVDFLSVGTNDLTQYVLAADRGNPLVATLYDSTHPSLLMLLKRIVEGAHKAGVEVGLCGEMAGDPHLVPILLALEMNYISLSAGSVPLIKEIIRNVTLEECKKWLDKAVRFTGGTSIRDQLNEWYGTRFKDISV
jgi:phosphoenolpyruvate-protein phosphotransferase (PTS system enzyme I)